MISLLLNLVIIPLVTLIFSFFVRDLWKLARWAFCRIKCFYSSRKKSEKTLQRKTKIITLNNSKKLSSLEVDSIDNFILRKHFGSIYDYIYVSFKYESDFRVKQLETGQLLLTIEEVQRILKTSQSLS